MGILDWDGFLACRAGISDPTYPWSTRSGEVAASATIAVVANRWPPASNGCAATSVNSEILPSDRIEIRRSEHSWSSGSPMRSDVAPVD